jgi:hypothetical protein
MCTVLQKTACFGIKEVQLLQDNYFYSHSLVLYSLNTTTWPATVYFTHIFTCLCKIHTFIYWYYTVQLKTTSHRRNNRQNMFCGTDCVLCRACKKLNLKGENKQKIALILCCCWNFKIILYAISKGATFLETVRTSSVAQEVINFSCVSPTLKRSEVWIKIMKYQ